MRIHYLQHVSFEGPGRIDDWAKAQGFETSVTRLFKDEPLPDVDEFDWLVVLGGPMGTADELKHPWLAAEKEFIKNAIASDRVVVGVCLGAQLIADVLGAKVYKGEFTEIGWFPVSVTDAAAESPVFQRLPTNFTPLHWHGDTFDLPAGCTRMASSVGCENQAFVMGDKVVGLQFHLEPSQASIKALIDNCGHELVEGKYIQSAEVIRRSDDKANQAYEVMNSLLDSLYELNRG